MASIMPCHVMMEQQQEGGGDSERLLLLLLPRSNHAASGFLAPRPSSPPPLTTGTCYFQGEEAGDTIVLHRGRDGTAHVSSQEAIIIRSLYLISF
ncbi:hypothetical protein ABZP36_004239 [Zizania latifolia]